MVKFPTVPHLWIRIIAVSLERSLKVTSCPNALRHAAADAETIKQLSMADKIRPPWQKSMLLLFSTTSSTQRTLSSNDQQEQTFPIRSLKGRNVPTSKKRSNAEFIRALVTCVRIYSSNQPGSSSVTKEKDMNTSCVLLLEEMSVNAKKIRQCTCETIHLP